MMVGGGDRRGGGGVGGTAGGGGGGVLAVVVVRVVGMVWPTSRAHHLMCYTRMCVCEGSPQHSLMV
jgi:hypothetical protein